MFGSTTSCNPAIVPAVEPWVIKPAAFCGAAAANSGLCEPSTAASNAPKLPGSARNLLGVLRTIAYESEIPSAIAAYKVAPVDEPVAPHATENAYASAF